MGNTAFAFMRLASLAVAITLIIVCTLHLVSLIRQIDRLNRCENSIKSGGKDDWKDISDATNHRVTTMTTNLKPSFDVLQIANPPTIDLETNRNKAKLNEETGKQLKLNLTITQEEERKALRSAGDGISQFHKIESFSSQNLKQSQHNDSLKEKCAMVPLSLVLLKKVGKCIKLGIVLASCSIGLGILQIIIVGASSYPKDLVRRRASYGYLWIFGKFLCLVAGIILLIARVIIGDVIDNNCGRLVSLSNAYILEVNIAVNVLFILVAFYSWKKNRSSAIV